MKLLTKAEIDTWFAYHTDHSAGAVAIRDQAIESKSREQQDILLEEAERRYRPLAPNRRY